MTTEKKYVVPHFEVWFTVQSDNSIRIHTQGCTTGSSPCYTVERLVKEIEALCGKGSYLVKSQNHSNGYHKDEAGNTVRGNLGCNNSSWKDSVVSQALKCAEAAGWLLPGKKWYDGFIHFADVHGEFEPVLKERIKQEA